MFVCFSSVTNLTVQMQSLLFMFLTLNFSVLQMCNFADCGGPAIPVNGQIVLNSSNLTTIGSTANQSCNTGYNISGSSIVECLSNGNWSESAVCKLIGNHKTIYRFIY